MGLNFKGFSLIRLTRAIDESTPGGQAFAYEVTIHDHFGRVKFTELKVHEVDRDWCKLRMEGERFAMMVSGVCKPITEQEYLQLINKEET